MIVLGYIGAAKEKTFSARIGWALIRLVQTGRTYYRVTHTELLIDGDCNAADIASATLLDSGGVRIKLDVALNPAHWMAVDLPDTADRNPQTAAAWFFKHEGQRYDRRGAPGSVLMGIGQADNEWFCNEACGAALRQTDPHKMPPAGFMAWVMDQPGARDVTAEFFKKSTKEALA
jgi:hypothetical protein